MGADDRMLRRHSRSGCVCPNCTHPRDMARTRAEDNRHTAREVRDQFDMTDEEFAEFDMTEDEFDAIMERGEPAELTEATVRKR